MTSVKIPKDNMNYHWVMISVCPNDAISWRDRSDCYTSHGLEYFNCRVIKKLEVALAILEGHKNE